MSAVKSSDDLHLYTGPDFRPELVANAVVRNVTIAQDAKVDVGPALTRLRYDLQETERRMKDLCRSNIQTLYLQTANVNKTTNDILALGTPLDNLRQTFSKIENDFLWPYNEAVSLRGRSERAHRTAALCRSLNYYLQLALQAQSQDYARETVRASREAGGAMVRTAQAMVALARLVSEVTDLHKINAVASFEQRVPQLRTQLIDQATKMVHEFKAGDTDEVKQACFAISLLGSDLKQVVSAHCRALVGASVLQISRNSGTPAGHLKAWCDAQDRGATARSLTQVCEELLKTVEEDKYWGLVATQLDQKLKTMSLANPATMKAFVLNKESILQSTQAVEEVHSVFLKYL